MLRGVVRGSEATHLHCALSRPYWGQGDMAQPPWHGHLESLPVPAAERKSSQLCSSEIAITPLLHTNSSATSLCLSLAIYLEVKRLARVPEIRAMRV